MYRKNMQGWVKHLDFIMLDIVCLHMALILSFMARHGSWNLYEDDRYRNIILFLTLTDFCVAIVFRSFKNVLKRDFYTEFTAVIKHVCLVEMLAMCYMFTSQTGGSYSRIVFYLLAPVYIVISCIARTLWKKHLIKKMREGGNRSLVLITSQSALEQVIDDLRENNLGSCVLTGAAVFDGECGRKAIKGIPVVSGLDDAIAYIHREWVDEVLIVLPMESYPAEFIYRLREMGVTVHVAIAKAGNMTGERQQIERLANYTVLTTSLNYATPIQLMTKRIMDILGGTAGCLITAVLFVTVGPLIWLQSPGPVLFSQIRVGRNGKKFRMYKFRTMYPDAEERKKEFAGQNKVGSGMMFKLDFDPRIIGNKKLPDGSVKKGLGSFLRETSLDEFPQMFNILKGDMSLVGTRPPTVDEWEKYELHHRARMCFRPGLTGLWQVSGRSDITDFEDVVKLDTKYINEWSIGMDLRILLKTVRVVFGRKGAR